MELLFYFSTTILQKTDTYYLSVYFKQEQVINQYLNRCLALGQDNVANQICSINSLCWLRATIKAEPDSYLTKFQHNILGVGGLTDCHLSWRQSMFTHSQLCTKPCGPSGKKSGPRTLASVLYRHLVTTTRAEQTVKNDKITTFFFKQLIAYL